MRPSIDCTTNHPCTSVCPIKALNKRDKKQQLAIIFYRKGATQQMGQFSVKNIEKQG